MSDEKTAEDLRLEAEAEIKKVLEEKNCKLTIEDVLHDGRPFSRSVVITTV